MCPSVATDTFLVDFRPIIGYNGSMKKRTVVLAAFTAMLACVMPVGCDGGQSVQNPVSYSNYTFVMGTEASILLSDADNFQSQQKKDAAVQLWSDVKAMLLDVEASISVSVENSYVCKFNQAEAGEEVEIDRTTYEVFTLALEMYEKTEGYYNPAVYYSVDLYGFSPNSTGNYPTDGDGLPTEEYIQAFQSLSEHFGDVRLHEESGKYYAVKPDAQVTVDDKTYSLAVDLGGIGKGYCADLADHMIDEAGFAYGYFNFGSSSYAIKSYLKSGDKSGSLYTMSVRDPRGTGLEAFCSVPVEGVCLSTSGDYENYFELGGVRYCHIIDPKTGSPIRTGMASATVIDGSAAEDDAYSTALSCMSVEKASKFIREKLSDRKVILLHIDGNGGTILTNCADEITVTASSYTVVDLTAS